MSKQSVHVVRQLGWQVRFILQFTVVLSETATTSLPIIAYYLTYGTIMVDGSISDTDSFITLARTSPVRVLSDFLPKGRIN